MVKTAASQISRVVRSYLKTSATKQIELISAVEIYIDLLQIGDSLEAFSGNDSFWGHERVLARNLWWKNLMKQIQRFQSDQQILASRLSFLRGRRSLKQSMILYIES